MFPKKKKNTWGRKNMKTKKISLIIITLLISQLCVGIVSATPIDFRGYVYYGDDIVAPDQVIAHVNGEDFDAIIPTDPVGYYWLIFEGVLSDEVTFDVVLSGVTYGEVEVHTIANSVNTNFNLTIDPMGNNPPSAPYNPTPTNGAINQNRNVDLSWSCEDPDGDDLTYSVFFADYSPPGMVDDDISDTTYDLGTLAYSETYYWQIKATDEHGISIDGPIWQFTVKAASTGDDDDDDDDDDVTPPLNPGGGGGDTGGPSANAKPIAAATVDKTTGPPGTIFNFDASGSEDTDGTIETYTWDFDDGTGEFNGVTISHTFSSEGTYEVMLTVEDTGGLTDDLNDPIIIEIVVGNIPPTDLTITPSETMTSIETDVEFTISATDEDENDTITYAIDWDDDETMTSDPYNSTESFIATHQWDTYGVYTVTVTAQDSENATTVGTAEVWVDVYVIDDEINGWLIDSDSDGTFDLFLNSDTESETELGMQDDKYLIDADGDDTWDYIFDMDTETLSAYTEDDGDGFNIALYVLAGLIVLLIIVFGYLSYKNKQAQKKKEQQKKQEKKKSSDSKKKKQSSTKSKRSK